MENQLDETYSVTETIEEGNLLVTAHPGIWTVDGILYWPPFEHDRSVCIPPGSDWTPHDCKVLKKNIETFEEALNEEIKYSNHRNSDSFREAEARKKFKRYHPVIANQSGSDMIDVNDIMTNINAAKRTAKSASANVDAGLANSDTYKK